MILNLILLQFIVVFIIDISGFVDTIKEKLAKLLTNGRISTSNFRIRPFDCSLCSTFWAGTIFLFITHSFTIPYFALVCLLAATSKLTADTYYTLADLFIKLLKKIS